jgi:endonuclease YncB( thermonuclease family)
MLRASPIVLLLALLCAAPLLRAEPWQLHGRVIGVHDGDSLTLLDGSRHQHKIRLNGIDAPELGQPYGQASRRALLQQAVRRKATAHCIKTDAYGRQICQVTVDELDLALHQLGSGMAWYFGRYRRDLPQDLQQQYEATEQHSRQDSTGLWSQPSPMPPWQWRAAQRPKATD